MTPRVGWSRSPADQDTAVSRLQPVTAPEALRRTAAARTLRAMDDSGLNVIQPGWEVYSSDGERIGRVDEVGRDHLRLELEVLAGSSVPIPLDAVTDAADGRVDLDLPTDAVVEVTVEDPTGS